MKKLLITIILLSVCIAQAQTDEKKTLRQLSQNALSAYQNQKLGDAIKFGQQAVDLSLKIYGAETVETAVAYTNLGVIYRDKSKLKEATENLQKALNIYQKIPGFDGRELVKAFETLAFTQFLNDRLPESAANYLQAIKTADAQFGKDSKESFSPTLELANLYASDRKFETADEFYLKSYALAIKNFKKDSREIEQIDDARSCLVVGVRGAAGAESQQAFREAREKLFGNRASEDVGILNGKAKSLPRPLYPPDAREQRLDGSVSVRVKINEQGNVTEARVICGNPVFGRGSLQSAKGAKFEPTLIDGKPVKVSGIIIFNYVISR